MKPHIVHVAILALVLAVLLVAPPVRADGVPSISIVHAPPTDAAPGGQIYLTATITNATSASIAWRNDTMTADSVVPMTNLSMANGTGWVYAAYLPAQPVPTQITYSINASNAGGSRIESYFFSVSAPTASGITAAEQDGWILTMAASLSMAVSTVAALYWYTGRRLRREVT